MSTPTGTLLPAFDYDPPDTYDGVAESFMLEYQTLHVYDVQTGPMSSAGDLASVIHDLDREAHPGDAKVLRVGKNKPRTGYCYLNPHLFPGGINPNNRRMTILETFLKSIPFVPPSGQSLPMRLWWVDMPDQMELRLQRLVISCFDEEALDFVQARVLADAKKLKKTLNQAQLAEGVYGELYRGLIRKTHHWGSAGPHHFDVMMSIVDLYAKLTPSTAKADLEEMFGDALPTERLEHYTNHIGLMCSGLAGNFARYARRSGHPGRWRHGGKQTLNGGPPIPPCPTNASEVPPSGSPPSRWNLAGQEGANLFGKDNPPVKFAQRGLARMDVAHIQPGDYICYRGIKPPKTDSNDDADEPAKTNPFGGGPDGGSHVMVINTVESRTATSCAITTLEACGEGAVNGLILSKDMSLKQLGGGVFEMMHLHNILKHVNVRRINHWDSPRHDMTDI